MLPLWVQWTQAVLLLVISCLGAWIAYKQVRIAEAKLNLDLFDKRFKVFEAARKLVRSFLQDGGVETEEILEFNGSVIDAVFLFDPNVETYLDSLRKNVLLMKQRTISFEQ